MSGGFINRQDARDHQVVIFTFAGAVSPDQVDAWNAAIQDLKANFGSSITGVTITGGQSPAPAALAKGKARMAAKAGRARKAAKKTRRR